jgi:TolB-like protein/Tfp pilus assembly protein PilF
VSRILKLNMLGGFQAQWSEGVLVSFSSKKAQALLAYLAVEADRPQSREKLSSLLWGNTGEDRARHNLRQAVAKIRKTFGDVVIGDDDCLKIDPESCTSDVGEFELLAKRDDSEALRRCLDLYRGNLLDGLNPREPEYVDWLFMARNRLRQSACQIAATLANRLVAEERPQDAITTLNKLLVLDPAHERTHQQLMELLSAVGRRSEALRQFRSCKDALHRELGVEPDASTKALHQKLLSDHQVVQSTGHDATLTPMVNSTAPAVAVLPFDNLSNESDGYFVDGIAEDLITALSCFHSLVVIARGSSFIYRDKNLSEKSIAQELGAQYLIRGSVQRADKRVRINVQLMDAEAGLQIWGHRYDREIEDVFALQDEITSTLVSTLAGRVEAARLNYARKAAPERLDAYDLLLRGKDHHHRFTHEDCRICIDMFNRAIERDPSFAVAHAWLACGTGQAMAFGLGDIPKLVDQSQAAAEKGLELDENESECHRILAQVHLTRRDLERALWYQGRALFLNPNDDRIVCAQGEILSYVGRAVEAEQWVRKAMRLNPYHPQRYWTHLARALFHLQCFDEAMSALDNVVKPRIDDLAYRVATAGMLGNASGVSARVQNLRKQFPDFHADNFIDSLPYTDEEYCNALQAPLVAALV